MKKFSLIFMTLVMFSCFKKNQSTENSYELKIRFADSLAGGLLGAEYAPQTAEHLANLIKLNAYDGGSVTRKENLIIISPVKKNEPLYRIKIPMEVSRLTISSSVFGIVRSPILEEGDSKIFLCLNQCKNLGSEFIPVGEITDQDPKVSQVQTGQKVLTILIQEQTQD